MSLLPGTIIINSLDPCGSSPPAHPSLADEGATLPPADQRRDSVSEHEGCMETRLKLEILPQPNDTTCGPTCLHAVYRYYGDSIPLDQVIVECRELEGGGTLAVLLGEHALRRGYQATIFTYNLQVFDPTWFAPDAPSLPDRLQRQSEAKNAPKLHFATQGYLDFLALGGTVRMEDLTAELLRRFLVREIPILTGLSATYLYQEPREVGPPWIPDDIRGHPAGHFVVLCGYDPTQRVALIADPLMPNAFSTEGSVYPIPLDRVICSILLGIVTYDANLLIIQPSKKQRQRRRRADRHRRE